jgi:hypothetical protein
MDNQELSKLLQQLRDEIKTTPEMDEKGTDLLRDLDEDIHALLERSKENPDRASVQRMEDVLYYFEATHPKLTAMISKLLESLSNAGI